MATTSNPASIVLPWKQQTLKTWKAQAARAIEDLRNMGLIEIKKPLADIQREFAQLMADPVLQPSADIEQRAEAEQEPAWMKLVPAWVFEEDEAEQREKARKKMDEVATKP
ncbi:MAG: hypothetical protein GYA24_00460 [Candidatus Lokiarchaeota archaeon]|nr:hypothetical protein [Candidatus Lokiarchaeota archaeon]